MTFWWSLPHPDCELAISQRPVASPSSETQLSSDQVPEVATLHPTELTDLGKE